VDSGASDHMIFRKEWFTNYELFETQSPVNIGDGKYIMAIGKGNINEDFGATTRHVHVLAKITFSRHKISKKICIDWCNNETCPTVIYGVIICLVVVLVQQ